MAGQPLDNYYQHYGLGNTSVDDGESVASRHPQYIANIEKYDLINTLLGGSSAMRAAGTRFLPRFENEEASSYATRLERSFLNPSFSVAIESHASKPFSVPVVVENHSEDLRLASLIDNTDGQGNDLTEFSKRLFTDADSYGMTHILADYSVSDAQSLGEEIASGAGVNLVHIRCLDLFYWDAELVNGKHRLTEIRYFRDSVVPHGPFGKKQVRQVVRWMANNWEVWQKVSDTNQVAQDRNEKDLERMANTIGDWELVETGVNTLGEIPLTTIYFKRTGFMEAEPPNYELAETVLEHYQDMSDQKNLESVARVGMLFASGFDEDETKGISIGPKVLIQSENTEASLKVVEHTGAAVSVGRNSLKILEDKMEELSLKPEINRTSGDVTASEVLTNSFNSSSELIYWSLAIQDGLKQAFINAYKWIGATPSDDFLVNIYTDFTIVGNMSDIPVLIDSHREGIIDQKTVLVEMIRRGSLDTRHSVEGIMDATKQEADDKMKRDVELAKATQPKESDEEDSSSGDSAPDDGMQND